MIDLNYFEDYFLNTYGIEIMPEHFFSPPNKAKGEKIKGFIIKTYKAEYLAYDCLPKITLNAEIGLVCADNVDFDDLQALIKPLFSDYANLQVASIEDFEAGKLSALRILANKVF